MKTIIIDPTLDERSKFWEKYYCEKMYCKNCSKPNGLYDGGIDVYILMGVKLSTKKYVCPNCGCKTLSFN